MIEALAFVSQRSIVVTLAILGAILVITGSLTARSSRAGIKTDGKDTQRPLSRHLTTAGYFITFSSIILFIIAGFIADL